MDTILNYLKEIRFADPEKLQLLYLAAALFLFGFLVWLAKLFSRTRKTHGSRYPFLGTMKLWLSLLLLSCFCIGAYARPYIPRGHVVVTRGNAEVVFVFDYSFSMFLRDTGLARLDIAGREGVKVVSGETLKKGDRGAVFIFGKLASPRIFLTGDLGIISGELGKIGRPDNLHENDLYWGTAVGPTLKRVCESLDRQDMFAEVKRESDQWQPKRKDNRLVIMFTDGDFFNYGGDKDAEQELESDKKDLAEALSELKKRGVPVYPVGIGTTAGGSLTGVLADYRQSEYNPEIVKDLEGQYSKLNTVTLDYIARATGGHTFVMEHSNADAGGFISSVIDRHRSIFVEPTLTDEKEELHRQFLYAGLSVFLLLGIVFTKF